MKKIYTLLFSTIGVSGFSQTLYQANTETASRFNFNNDSVVVYDDCVLSLPGSGQYAVKITKLDVGIRRLASAPVVDVALYVGRAGADTVPQTIDSLTRVPLPALGASASTDIVSYNSATGFTMNLVPLSASAQKAGVFVGVRFMGPNANDANIGWRIVNAPATGTAGPNFYAINRVTNSLAGPYYFTGTPGYFYTTITGTFQAALPIDISLFKASLINNDVLLNWTTESESNSSHFEIEVSKNGLDFKSAGRVSAAGNSAVNKAYTFTQPKPSPGTYYYRLKMVDKDNTYKFSAVEKVTISGKSMHLIVAPNPVKDAARFNWPEQGAFRFQLLGINGKQFKIGAVVQGKNEINMGDLSMGIYILDVIDNLGHIVASQKLIKQ